MKKQACSKRARDVAAKPARRRPSSEVARKLASGSKAGLWNGSASQGIAPGLSSRKHSAALSGLPVLADAFGRGRKQQDALAVPVLKKTFALLLLHGWLRPHEFSVLGNGEAPSGWHLIEALQSSGPKKYPDIECWYARRALMRVESELCRWEAHPARTRDDVLRLIARAIELCGGVAPSIPRERPARLRGGWRVSA